MTANKRGANTREKVITEAAKQFYLQGYKDTTMRALAAAVGIKHPSLFSIFQNKSAIASVLLTRYFDGLDRSAKQFIEEKGLTDDPKTRLLTFQALNYNLVYIDRRFAEFFSSFYDENSEGVDALVMNLGHLSQSEEEDTDPYHELDKKVLGLSAMLLVRELGERTIDPRIATRYFVEMIVQVNGKALNLTSEEAAAFYQTYFDDIAAKANTIDIYKDYLLSDSL